VVSAGFPEVRRFQGAFAAQGILDVHLFNLLIALGLGMLAGLVGGRGGGLTDVVSGLYTLVVFVPSLALSVRRLHDIGKSGWWMLISLIPLVGPLIVLFFMVKDSQPGTNEYGPNPKEAVLLPA
jgi:uncharacterized membrane protein YhaH (DUF805 family)